MGGFCLYFFHFGSIWLLEQQFPHIFIASDMNLPAVMAYKQKNHENNLSCSIFLSCPQFWHFPVFRYLLFSLAQVWFHHFVMQRVIAPKSGQLLDDLLKWKSHYSSLEAKILHIGYICTYMHTLLRLGTGTALNHIPISAASENHLVSV